MVTNPLESSDHEWEVAIVYGSEWELCVTMYQMLVVKYMCL